MAQSQSSQLEESSKLVIALSESIQRNAANADSSSVLTQQTSKLALEGSTSGKQSVEALLDIQKFMANVTTTIKRLDQTVKDIIIITASAKDVADQTNLLALNAAIEAAHAGEAGRGFAVVADQIRKLAEATKESATQIESLVNAIVESTNEVASGMESGTEQMSKSRDSINQSFAVLDKISISMEDVNAKAQDISGTTAEQAASTQQFAKTIEELSAGSEQTAVGATETSSTVQQQSAAMQQITSSAQNLSAVSKKLSSGLAKYTTGDQRMGGQKKNEDNDSDPVEGQPNET